MNKQEIIEFYNKQIELEEKIVESAENTIQNMKNKMVRELILGIAMDSNKHASLLNALIALNSESTPLIAEEITDQIKLNLETHIELEQYAIDNYQKLWKVLDNEKEKLVIKAILNDEIRHHKLLKQIYTMIIEKEGITEQDLWDWTWKDSLFHGTPGG
ncbi:MAG: ferritin-like domain-containing protein [Candidatus Hodarchaeales archaeon]|jgi:rubrerythrin